MLELRHDERLDGLADLGDGQVGQRGKGVGGLCHRKIPQGVWWKDVDGAGDDREGCGVRLGKRKAGGRRTRSFAEGGHTLPVTADRTLTSH
ncbi:hypothetical protein GCM10018779_07820 [Streptomyces griseocarneus]|nr:hypothetical protein GCM10018779_07820 [Streptomyces griseocarneus]